MCLEAFTGSGQEVVSDKLIVLGAGASIGGSLYPKHGSWQESLGRMPSAENFFYDVFHHATTPASEERWIDSLGLMAEGLHDFIVEVWGLNRPNGGFDPDVWKGVNIEAVFTFLDIGARTYNRGTDYQKAFSGLMEELEDFICLMVGVRSADQHCEFLRDVFSRLSENDTVISFNWDTIADMTLHGLHAPQYASYESMLRGGRFNVQSASRKGQYLKLHGSLNWIACRNRACRLHTEPVIPFLDREGPPPTFTDTKPFEKCPECGFKRPRRMIVPPTSHKLIRRGSFLHRLWLIARYTLPRISKIVFIGYSFPPTDFYSTWLFRQFRFIDAPDPEVVVVNPAMSDESSEMRRRYMAIFPGIELQTYETLKDFARSAWRSM